MKKYPKIVNGSLKLRRPLEGMTPGQDAYLANLKTSDVSLCDGPAGSGKTWLAVGIAAKDVLERTSRREQIIVARPIVQAGEDLGFLPGDLHEKTDPYMVPIFETFKQFCRDDEEFKTSTDKIHGCLKVCPLAFLRGRTMDNAWMILDESQNCTAKQIELFLTRMGRNSRAILLGSLRQCDLPNGPEGWRHAIDRLSEGGFRRGRVTFSQLTKADIVRNDLIAEIIERLEPLDDGPDDGPVVYWKPENDRRDDSVDWGY